MFFINNYLGCFLHRSLKEIMKCLLCSGIFDNNEDLIEHFISYVKIHSSNRFS